MHDQEEKVQGTKKLEGEKPKKVEGVQDEAITDFFNLVSYVMVMRKNHELIAKRLENVEVKLDKLMKSIIKCELIGGDLGKD